MIVLDENHLYQLCYLRNTAVQYSKSSATKKNLFLGLKICDLVKVDEDGFVILTETGEGHVDRLVLHLNDLVKGIV